MTSIMHRASGMFLAAGCLLLAWWLWTAAYDRAAFDQLQQFLSGIFGLLLLFAWSLAFFYHFCNGIRHLVWDAGYGYTVPVATKTGFTAIGVAIALTALTWIVAWPKGQHVNDVSQILMPV